MKYLPQKSSSINEITFTVNLISSQLTINHRLLFNKKSMDKRKNPATFVDLVKTHEKPDSRILQTKPD